jgi:hypothetical protein
MFTQGKHKCQVYVQYNGVFKIAAFVAVNRIKTTDQRSGWNPSNEAVSKKKKIKK